jgi:DNA invertase Pin-like site-specific DNA recombinase
VRDGIEIAAWFIEEVSGGASLEKRPILLQAIAALNDHKAGLLVVQRLDRFSRDPLTAAMAEIEVAKFGARVVTADGVGNGDDPGSRLMKDIGLAAARFERAMIAARTKAALAVKKVRGETTGTPPYGWRVGDDGKGLVAAAEEQAVLVRLRGLRSQGWAYRAIREEATRLGFVGRTGMPFTLQAVFAMTTDAAPDGSPALRGRCARGDRSNWIASSRNCSDLAPRAAGVGISGRIPISTNLCYLRMIPCRARLRVYPGILMTEIALSRTRDDGA